MAIRSSKMFSNQSHIGSWNSNSKTWECLPYVSSLQSGFLPVGDISNFLFNWFSDYLGIGKIPFSYLQLEESFSSNSSSWKGISLRWFFVFSGIFLWRCLVTPSISVYAISSLFQFLQLYFVVVMTLTSKMLNLSHDDASLLAFFISHFLLCWFPEVTVSQGR